MKLNQFTDFGLRITMYMAQKQVTGDSTTRSELSERVVESPATTW